MPLNETSNNTVQYTVTTTNTADGTTLYWKTTGNVSNSDIVGGNTGSIVVTNNQAVFNVTIAADDATDGTKTLGIQILTGSVNGTPVVNTASPIVITDTSQTPDYGYLYSFGNNQYGVLGTGGGNVSSPVQVGALRTWTKISAGVNHLLSRKSDYTLWAWGLNGNGQLGNNSATNVSSPIQIGSDTNWDKVVAGYNTSFAIKTGGTLWAWGDNSYRQSGIGSGGPGSFTYVPTQVGALTNWSEVVGGYTHTLAVKTDGTLWVWGTNGNPSNTGALGLNESSPYQITNSPVQNGSATNWSKVSAGVRNSSAIETDGTLWTWGSPGYSLGHNTTSARSSPTQVGTGTTWSKISMNINGALVIKTDGTLWAWGNNSQGQLGTNDRITYSSPVQIGTDTNWSEVFCGKGNEFTLATKTNGTLWSWGKGNEGGLGSGSTASRSSPVQVGTGTTWLRATATTYAGLAILG